MTPLETLKKYWGYDSFRPLQDEIIDFVLTGRDTLALLPTGGGKSITFQVPGLIFGGMTLVITPLISLMKDQVDHLRQNGIWADMLHATMTSDEVRTTRERIYTRRTKFLYIAPERLGNENFLQELGRLPIKLIVVDEAHCISQWGYDFRPSYLQISKARSVLPNVPVLALTASATEKVADDICKQLKFRAGHRIYRKSFSRNNISFIVREPRGLKIEELVHILSHTTGSAIVYVRSRKRTREIADELNLHGISAQYYHAGLRFDAKEERHNLWTRGEVRVMVATNAFGMGIDKPDVRVVVHYDFPPSLEEYYQEAGRAGRDGLPSYAVLLRRDSDKALQKRRLTIAYPPKNEVLKIYERVSNFVNVSLGEGSGRLYQFDMGKFCETFQLQEATVSAALKILSWSGYMDYIPEINSRSRILVVVTREELYERQGISEAAEKVLTNILRTTTGIFAEYQYIDENKIGRAVWLDVPHVYEALLELSRAHLISYIPQSRLPYIYYPTSREEIRYIRIPRHAYESRKERQKERMDAMIDFAFSDRTCRVKRMLAYFGEKNSPDCQRCDVCRQRK